MLVHLLLEGRLEEPVAEKLLSHCGHEKGMVYGQQGCGYLHEKAKGFQYLAQPGCGVLVLTDLTGVSPLTVFFRTLRCNFSEIDSFLL